MSESHVCARDFFWRLLLALDAVGDTFGVSLGGCGRGMPEEGGIAPGVDAVGGVFEVLRGGCG